MKFNNAGKSKFINALAKVLKNPENHNLGVWIEEAESKYKERGHSISFEVNSQFTKSNNPVLIDLNESDFDLDYAALS